MALLDRYKTTPTPTSTLLSQEQAIAAFDKFIAGKPFEVIRLELGIEKGKLKTLETRLIEIIDMMERLVKREAWLVRPVPAETHIDEETGEEVIDVPAREGTICPAPSTIEKLKERALELVQNDYDVTEPLFDTDDIMELVMGLNYVIDQVIKYSEPDGSGTFDTWKAKVLG